MTAEGNTYSDAGTLAFTNFAHTCIAVVRRPGVSFEQAWEDLAALPGVDNVQLSDDDTGPCFVTFLQAGDAVVYCYTHATPAQREAFYATMHEMEVSA